MIHKGVPRTFFLYAYNISDGTPKTGDASNITVYKAEDTGTATQVTDTITEIDSTNMPGWYRVTTTLNGNSVALSARSSTSGVQVIVAGIYLNTGAIPAANAGESGGLPTVDANNRVAGLQSAINITSDGNTIDQTKIANLDAAITTRLAANSYVPPDNTSIAAIKQQTDKLHFTGDPGYEFVLASATVDVDEQAIADAVVAEIQDQNLVQVVVQPLAANLIQQATHGGHIVAWTHARITASWTIPGNDLSGHDLRMIIYKPSDPSTRIEEFKSDTGLTVSYNSGTGQSTISLNADPISAGSYAWIIRDQTTDTVILKGTVAVYAAPDAS